MADADAVRRIATERQRKRGTSFKQEYQGAGARAKGRTRAPSMLHEPTKHMIPPQVWLIDFLFFISDVNLEMDVGQQDPVHWSGYQKDTARAYFKSNFLFENFFLEYCHCHSCTVEGCPHLFIFFVFLIPTLLKPPHFNTSTVES